MRGRRWALLVGVNQGGRGADVQSLQYAERDARDLHDVLVDRVTGTFDTADVSLKLGGQATYKSIKAWLRAAVRESRPSDVLLVYFAGHACVPDRSRGSDVYLATADFDVKALQDDPDAGLRLAFLGRDVFEVFAGTSFLVLDCCHAGVHAEMDVGGFGSRTDRHSALLSCRSGEAARETNEYQHGVLTHSVLRALRREAAGPDGQVSFAQMADFVVNQGIHPTPGNIIRTWGPTTVLTRPSTAARDRGRPLTEPATSATVLVCESPMQRCASSILQLLGRVCRSDQPIGDHIGRPALGKLERIREAAQAKAAAVVEFSRSTVTQIDATPQFNQDGLAALLEQSGRRVFSTGGAELGHVSCDDGHHLLCVPLSHGDHRSLALAVVDPALSLLEMGEPLAAVLHALWHTEVSDSPLQTEVQVLTALRSTFGRLPLPLYEHCFARYRQLVDSLAMVFQPVIAIHPKPRGVNVHSYEALARLGAGDTLAPVTALQTAHVWGDRFVIERDVTLLRTAITSYVEADKQGPWDSPKPIAVNVSVRSLLSDVYRDVVGDVLDGVPLARRAVTLEISEQDPIRPAPDEQWPKKPLAYFHDRLIALARDLEISFAVDDFGVGYASLARMAELPLTQIKVDRAVLQHPLALDELDLVVRVAEHSRDQGHAPVGRVVVVEGLDRDCPVKLHDLYRHKIHYVQGFITGEPGSPSLRLLGEDARARIAALTRGDDVQRHIEAPARRHRGTATAA